MNQTASLEQDMATEEEGLESNPLAQEAMKRWGSRWVLMAGEIANQK